MFRRSLLCGLGAVVLAGRQTAAITPAQTLLLQSVSNNPSLDLNFLSGLLDPRISFTRASGATYFDATGTLQTAATNAPRIGYGPTPGGVTNWLLYSQDFTNAVWAKNAATTVTPNYALGIDGTTSAARVQLVSAGTQATTLFHQPVFGASLGAFQTNTVSAWVRSNTGGNQTFALKCTQGAVADHFSSDLTATPAWQRFQFSVAFTAGGSSIISGVSVGSAQAAADIVIWGLQLEIGASSAGGYVPTSGTPANVGAVPLGLLIEEQRTNSIRNPRAEGAVASATMSPPAAPTLGQTLGGALTGATYYVKTTYVDGAGGETLVSPESSFAVTAANLLTVASPASSPGAVSWRVYVSTSTGTETRQATTAIGTNWTEPTSGLVAGAAMPGSATAKTPGTMPTNWIVGSSNGVSMNVVGTGTESGIPYIDVQFVGTATGTATPTIYFETQAAISAANGQTWSITPYLRLVAGTNTIAPQIGFGEFSSAPAFLASHNSTVTAATSAALAGQRQSAAIATNQATCASIQPFIFFTIPTTTVVNFTLRIGAPQLEQGAFATSLILPAVGTPAATTRAADAATMATGPWYNQRVGTLAAEFVLGGRTITGAGNAFVSLAGANSGTDFITAITLSNASPPLWAGNDVFASSVDTYVTGNSAIVPIGSVSKAATSWGVGAVVNGTYNGTLGTPSAGLLAATPGIATLQLGGSVHYQSPPTGYIRRVRYWPRALANQELQQVTT